MFTTVNLIVDPNNCLWGVYETHLREMFVAERIPRCDIYTVHWLNIVHYCDKLNQVLFYSVILINDFSLMVPKTVPPTKFWLKPYTAVKIIFHLLYSFNISGILYAFVLWTSLYTNNLI